MTRRHLFKLPLLMIMNFTLALGPIASAIPARSTRELAQRLRAHDSFEIYLVPEKHNMIVDEDKMFSGWKSHFIRGGAPVELTHAGTDHNTIHDYDTHVPLIFSGRPYCEPGHTKERVAITQVAPTLARLLDVDMVPTPDAPLLKGCQKTTHEEGPRAVLLIVVDQGGWFTLNQHPGHWPHIKQMMAEGLSFDAAHTDYGGSGTSASHASLATGTFPRDNGVFTNEPYFPALDKASEVYTGPAGIEPNQLLRATLMDRFLATHQERAVTLAYSSASRAAVGMAGHGSSYRGAAKSQTFWFDLKKQEFSSDSSLFLEPESAKGKGFDEDAFLRDRQGIWTKQECRGRDGRTFTKCLLGSPAFAKLEGDILVQAILDQKEKLTKEGSRALVMVSFKGVDYCGHFLGQESLECRDTLSETDRQIGRLLETMSALSKGKMVAVITADHGVAPLTLFSKGSMLHDAGLTATLNQKFGGPQHRFSPIKHVMNNSIKIDLGELRTAGHDLDDLVTFLKDYKIDGRPFFREVLAVDTTIRANARASNVP